MPPIKAGRLANRVSALLVSTAVVVTPALAQTVGTAAAVNPTTQGTPPGAAARVLRLGSGVLYRERIETTSEGSLQVLFLDKTTLNIGPNSEIVIDEYVYEPRAGVGRAIVSLSKGVMRFVGGQISHSGGATVRTPAAMIGIRGGTATIMHGVAPGSAVGAVASAKFGHAATGTLAMLHFGLLRVLTGCPPVVIRRPGFMTAVPAPGECPTEPERIPAQLVTATLSVLTSHSAQTGGLGYRPGDIGDTISAGVTPRTPPPPSIFNPGDDIVKDAQQQLATQPPAHVHEPELPTDYCQHCFDQLQAPQ